ncbi:hypothetical protein MUN81_16640 [Hymenobacter sp. 5317J-9]|uniref:hypothetical protein n=1 Tax=Hymenobacter sp. 5317J-9 TaxID=2932250 RepID=UPI001FD67762|nr:hypothetical protein [Hymenobacter sp. 5317J-9]UOQ96863.1 hypothetical protein MUN81_16640 [Hymenobacter sp. 5317J-9]
MKTPFKLDAHPRRPRPLSEPPAGYFDKLPMQIMARLPQAEAHAAAPGWLAWLTPALRTSLASVAVLGGFAASFFLSGPAPQAPVAATTLDAVPRTELVGYLLTSGARVENSDLAVLTAAHPNIAKGFLHASEEELTQALDDQPSEDLTYL